MPIGARARDASALEFFVILVIFVVTLVVEHGVRRLKLPA